MKGYQTSTVVILLAFLAGCAKEDHISSRKPELQWRTLLNLDFEDASTPVRQIQTDPGLSWSVRDGKGYLTGRPSDSRWLDDGVELLLSGDRMTAIEVSFDFRVDTRDGYHLINLTARTDDMFSYLCMFFERSKGKGHYRIQTEKLKHPHKLIEGAYQTPAFGDEDKVFHRMRIIHDRATSQTSYYVDDRHLGTVQVNGEIGPIQLVRMSMETPSKGYDVGIEYDNLTVKVAGPERYAKHNQDLRESLIQHMDTYFFNNRTTILTPEVLKWSDFIKDDAGNESVRCRYYARIARKHMICEQVLTFDSDGNLASIQNAAGFPKSGHFPQTGEE